MKDLELNNRLVIEWPRNKNMPELGDKIDGGQLGFAIVTAVQAGWSRVLPVKRLVQLEVFQKIKLVKPKKRKATK